MVETPIVFISQGMQLVGICHHAKTSEELTTTSKGLIVVVGGPQTKFGSHRQFVQLARSLAQQGIDVFRFDYTGAGDSEGGITSFESITPDIDAAVGTFMRMRPNLKDITLWGLCDAASAILLYQNEYHCHHIKSLVLLNPWVQQRHTQAQALLKYYYVKRLFSGDFWKKLFTGRINIVNSAAEINHFTQQSKPEVNQTNYVDRMYSGIASFSRPVTIILSGNDLTAQEFICLRQSNKKWMQVIAKKNIRCIDIVGANHTFSSQRWKNEVINITMSAI